MEFWIVYDLATGEELYVGQGAIGTAAYQQAPEGCGVILVPAAMVRQVPRDLDALRAALVMGVDNEAERMRATHITALPGHVSAYWLKAEAARRWLADNDASTVMLASEARARGMTIAELAAQVIAKADAWAIVADAIEGIRFTAKAAIEAATTIGAIAQAAVIDWTVLDEPNAQQPTD
jgi:hypothetical protein